MPYVKATNRHVSDDGKKRAPGDVYSVSSAEATRRGKDGQVKRVKVEPVETKQATPASKPKPAPSPASAKVEPKSDSKSEGKDDKA
ncbi:hypothetical protein F4561_002667 [Lipingzhangella halophila]|uniref:Uncharacterized protein n=1 Tax=Lipingzhangella halophila TaxID=1783352 RepID=A0A7W7RH27_9ACTN|nr:hypothetical protein [Lipingzhangella halophila]MBB4931847.1 hypothetical protein [Lipingzhangella halophila]